MLRKIPVLMDRQPTTEKRATFLIEVHHRMPDRKLIVIMHTCMRCGRTFQPKKGRTRCPDCRGLLRNKTTILNVP